MSDLKTGNDFYYEIIMMDGHSMTSFGERIHVFIEEIEDFVSL